MRKIVLVCFFMASSVGLIMAQNNAAYKALSDSLHKLKKEGKLKNYEGINLPSPGKTKSPQVSHQSKHHSKNNARLNNNNNVMSTPCNGWITRDSTFSPAHLDAPGGDDVGTPPLYLVDDCSTYGIALPFNFCFYGNTVGTTGDSMYINSNGIVTFGAAFTTFSPVSFPCTAVAYTSPGAAIAPFWGDVDDNLTVTSGGVIYWKVTPTYVIIQWDSVGVFDHTGQINSFQLIITNGTDPILPPGNNLSFSYGEMQWACGDASGGTAGFGGNPATVGLNKGDGVNYTQISLFDNASSVFTNPAGSPVSGIGWLVGKSFYFNTCSGGAAPVPLSGGGNPCAGDTLSVCAVGDTLSNTTSFSPGNPTQTVSVTATAPGLGSNFSILNTTSGATASLTFLVNTTGLSAPGNYNVSVIATNSGGVATTINYVIHILGSSLPNPTLTVNPSVTCGNTPPVITLANSSSYANWTWSTGTPSSSATTTVASTSTVQVTVFSAGGCQKSGSIFVPIYPTPTVSIGGILNYCNPTPNTLISANVSGGTSPYAYNWNHGLASTSTLSATGPHTGYTVVVSDTHGCKDSVTATVTSGSLTPLSITQSGNLCANSDNLISSITTATSYTWSGPGGTTTTASYSFAIGGTSGTYSLAIVINNCPTFTTITIPLPIPPTVTITPDTVICAGKSTTLTVTALPVGTYSYSWYNGATLLSSANTVTLNAPGTTYSVSVINTATQCKGSLPFFINLYTNPTVTITPMNGFYCKGLGDSLFAGAVGGTPVYNYAWAPGGGSTKHVYVVPTNTVYQTYTVTVTDSKGCQAVAFKKISEDNLNLVIPPAYFCLGSSTVVHAHTISGKTPYTYTWYPGPTSGTTYSISSPGTYSIAVLDAAGCKDSTTFPASLYPKPTASFTYAPSPPQQGTAIAFTYNTPNTLNDTAVEYIWYFGDLDTAIIYNPVINPPGHAYANGGTYTVTLIVVNENGCVDEATQVLNVQFNIIAPNIITPNGDGINEYLAFKNLQYFTNSKIWIYNRWGTLLYQNNDYKNDWTGKDYSDGTYFYILQVTEKDQTLKGFFESIK